MNNKHWQPAFINVILFAFLQNALTHPISLTSARALVYENKIDLAIDIMAEDYMLYYGLVPDTNNRIPADKLQQSLEEHRYSLSSGLKIFDQYGNKINGTVTQIEGSIPAQVITELMGIVLKIKTFFDANMIIIGISTFLLLLLVIVLSLRLRQNEMQIMFKIGCSRWTTVGFQLSELSIIFTISIIYTAISAILTIQLGTGSDAG